MDLPPEIAALNEKSINLPPIQATRTEQYRALLPTLVLLAVVAGGLIYLLEVWWRPGRDNSTIEINIATGCIIFLQIKLYTLHINSRMQELLQTTGVAQKAIGFILGTFQQQEITTQAEIAKAEAPKPEEAKK